MPILRSGTASAVAWWCLWMAILLQAATAQQQKWADEESRDAARAGYGYDYYDDAYDKREYRKREPEFRDYLFMVFRFGLFFFIICFPCLRAIRVWFLAGGRIRWRRTRGGWIIGLRYQAADLDRWLVLSGYHNNRARGQGGMGAGGASASITRKLTAEEVYALPEIKAPKPPANSEDGDVGDNGDLEMGTVATEEPSEDGNSNHGQEDNSNNNHGSSETTEASTNDESSPTTPPDADSVATTTATTSNAPKPPFTTTISTSCSICLDDFEEGETIRLLPGCGHAFHTECILPWLTERQGCCPYCKAAVVCPPATPEVADTDYDVDVDDALNTSSNSIIDDAEAGVRIPTSSTSTSTGTRASNSNSNSNNSNNRSRRYPYNSFALNGRNSPYTGNDWRTW